MKLYRNTPVITISESTKQDLLNLGFRETISILPVGISFKPLEQAPQKELNPTLIFVGRLRRSKRINHLIQALQVVRKQIPNIQLRIVGGGGKPRYEQKLNYLVRKWNLQNNITFYGYVDEQTKQDLIKQSHAIVVTSAREGWGIVVTEANALYTPGIGYNIAGIRDSIIDGQTGLLTKKNNPQLLSEVIVTLLSDKTLYLKLRQNALNKAKEFSWDRSAKETLAVLENTHARTKG